MLPTPQHMPSMVVRGIVFTAALLGAIPGLAVEPAQPADAPPVAPGGGTIDEPAAEAPAVDRPAGEGPTVAVPAEPVAPGPPEVAPPSTPASSPPQIADLAVAADNPVAAPVISLTVAPVDSVATLWWRAPGGAWTSVEMAGTGGPLRLARLPDGLQREGFAFYVDVVGGDRRARFGSRAAPVDVEPAVEGNRERSERDARDAAAFVGPHPAFVMIALGTGVLAGAGAGAFGYDLHITSLRLAAVDAALAAGPPDDERAALAAERSGLERAALQDTTATVLLGVVGGVALATGVTLLVVGAAEQ